MLSMIKCIQCVVVFMKQITASVLNSLLLNHKNHVSRTEPYKYVKSWSIGPTFETCVKIFTKILKHNALPVWFQNFVNNDRFGGAMIFSENRATTRETNSKGWSIFEMKLLILRRKNLATSCKIISFHVMFSIMIVASLAHRSETSDKFYKAAIFYLMITLKIFWLYIIGTIE